MPPCVQPFKEVGVCRKLKRKVQEGWGGSQEARVTELVKLLSELFRGLNLIKDIIKAQCFLKASGVFDTLSSFLCFPLSLSTGHLRME